MSTPIAISGAHPRPAADVARNGDAASSRGERWLFWYLVLAPLWWALGFLSLMAVLGLVTLFLLRPPRDPKIRIVVYLWFAVAAAQAVSVVVNWGFLQQVPWSVLPYRLLNTTVTGWALLGVAIGVGAEYRLASPLVIRGLCVFGLWVLVLGTGSYAAAHVFGIEDFWLRSPIGLLLPESLPAVRNYFTLNFFHSEPIFGVSVVRLILFFPWMNVLALAGITLVLACWAERSYFWRWIGIASGVFAVISSFSRSAVVALLVALAFIAWWRVDRGTRFVLVGVAAAAVNVLALLGMTPDQAISMAFEEFSSARSGSSAARELAYEMSWQGFLASPVVGQGWVGPIYSKEIPIPAGSHSTFYGLLYTAGVLGIVTFVVAFVGTVVLAVSRSVQKRSAVVALGLLIVLGFFAYGECLYSLVATWLAGFVWLGGQLAHDVSVQEASEAAEAAPIPEWQPTPSRIYWRPM